MTPDQARGVVSDALHQVAPDIDLEKLEVDADFRDSVQLDSIDFLNFVEILSDRSGLRIDEDDYPGLATFDGCVDFLSRRDR
jgi:acyl carrier protein